MSSPEKYREYVDECMGWAKSAKTDRERKIFLQMAATWLAAAIRLNSFAAGVRVEPRAIEQRFKSGQPGPKNLEGVLGAKSI
jgi:hypothetical protein